ncbi:MAG: hypothetical protein HZB31_02530 [Nitrospirae bacterium]|nr:hypothetical protein [Nitrospirota bacterium]
MFIIPRFLTTIASLEHYSLPDTIEYGYTARREYGEMDKSSFISKALLSDYCPALHE